MPHPFAFILAKGWDSTNAQMPETMQATLRKVLIDSHVAAIAIAVLLAGAIEFVFIALFDPASRVLSFLTIAVATNSPPYIPRTVDYAARNVSLQASLFDLSVALNNLACAWLISRWAYGTGPMRILRNYRDKLMRRKDA
ncbi:MAG TPA: hypothetical protein VGT08_02680 [Terracidiphilus sp.]|nr:hypothetical protein [Terracidiphilus sp.]